MPFFAIPRYLDGRGFAYMECSDAANERFRFHLIPAKYPSTAQLADTFGPELEVSDLTKRGDGYRIAVPERWSSGAHAKVRFTLQKRTPKATLEVIGEHLDQEGIPWLFFCNEAGTQLKGPRFRSKRNTAAA